MTNKNADSPPGDGGDGASLPSSEPRKPDQPHSFGSHTVFKSGPLFLSSKGIGWTSWKKRWFILTGTSLVFFRSDPSSVSEKGNEANLTLGGIDLNNTGSVVVKADKKLLTVLFPDGRDGRTFTLKAETTEDLNEWKIALENALAQAPSVANVTGQNVNFRNDQTESMDISSNQLKDKEPTKSTVIGQPILLALEDADGAPSFLEKALKFVEEHGVKVEGILRQAADVDHVEYRVREYEQGKVEFSPEEDAHVIADCIKHVLRELPSSPVPASCCKALLEACRTERAGRVSAMRAAICETFPEPNRRLLQRILLMMRAVASHKDVNRMSPSAVAACMAPLLLRALLHGECQIENDFDVGGDGSLQLLQAAAAANHGQTIVITLLEEYDSLFGEGDVSPEMYTDESGTESEEASDVGSYDDDDDDDGGDYDDEEDESVEGSDAENEDFVSEASSETENSRENQVSDDQDHNHSSSKSSGVSEDVKVNKVLSSNSRKVSPPQNENIRNSENLMDPSKTVSAQQSNKPAEVFGEVLTDQSRLNHSSPAEASCIKKSMTISNASEHNSQSRTMLGRTAAKKNVSMESIDYSIEDEKLEAAKTDMQNQSAEEIEGNSKPKSDQEKQKKALHRRRLALELDLAGLQEQLQGEKNSRATLEAGLPLSNLSSIDDKTKADLEELALVEVELTRLEQKVKNLGIRLNLQHKQNSDSALNKPQQTLDHDSKLKNKQDNEVSTRSQFGRSRSKDGPLGGAENDKERMLESTPLPSNQLSQSFSKKSGLKKEGGKRSFRLNFLKDKKSQVANELQNADKGQESGYSAQNPEKRKGSEFRQPPLSPGASQGSESYSLSNQEGGKGSEFGQPLPSTNKSQGSEIHCVSNPEKGRGSSSSLKIPEKVIGIEGQSHQNPEKMRKSGSHPTQHSDNWNQQPQHLERDKSEGHKPSTKDKGR